MLIENRLTINGENALFHFNEEDLLELTNKGISSYILINYLKYWCYLKFLHEYVKNSNNNNIDCYLIKRNYFGFVGLIGYFIEYCIDNFIFNHCYQINSIYSQNVDIFRSIMKKMNYNYYDINQIIISFYFNNSDKFSQKQKRMSYNRGIEIKIFILLKLLKSEKWKNIMTEYIEYKMCNHDDKDLFPKEVECIKLK